MYLRNCACNYVIKYLHLQVFINDNVNIQFFVINVNFNDIDEYFYNFFDALVNCSLISEIVYIPYLVNDITILRKAFHNL